MHASLLRRLAPGAAALALGLVPALVWAQDASPPGPPVTRPNTNQSTPANKTQAPANSQTPKTTADVLPGVPSTARDPAPPGTRGVRVDVPKGANANGAAVGRTNRTAQRSASARGQVFVAEGVVTRIDRAGKTVNGELERFAFDPSQDWNSYMTRGAQQAVVDNDEEPKTKKEVKDANARSERDETAIPNTMEMVITRRTYTFTHARSEDGVDMYNAATSATPDTSSSRTGLTRRTPSSAPASSSANLTSTAANTPTSVASPTTSTPPGGGTAGGAGGGLGGTPTNFTNIREGSFVAVRYRKVGDVNEVLNLTLIELPLNPEGAGAGTGTGTGAAATSGNGPAGANPAGGAAAPRATGAGDAARTPTVPRVPSDPGSLPR